MEVITHIRFLFRTYSEEFWKLAFWKELEVVTLSKQVDPIHLKQIYLSPPFLIKLVAAKPRIFRDKITEFTLDHVPSRAQVVKHPELAESSWNRESKHRLELGRKGLTGER